MTKEGSKREVSKRRRAAKNLLLYISAPVCFVRIHCLEVCRVFVIGSRRWEVTLAVEVLLATEALGPAYERLDLTAVERAE